MTGKSFHVKGNSYIETTYSIEEFPREFILKAYYLYDITLATVQALLATRSRVRFPALPQF